MNIVDVLQFINLLLCIVAFVLNSGAFLFFIRAKADKGQRAMKAFLIMITFIFEAILFSILARAALVALGLDVDSFGVLNTVNGFALLIILIGADILLYLISKDKIR